MKATTSRQLIKRQIEVHLLLNCLLLYICVQIQDNWNTHSTFATYFPWQKSEGRHWGWHQHACGRAFGECSVWRDRTPEMAVWCLVTWRHTGQSYGSGGCARVSDWNAETRIMMKAEIKRQQCMTSLFAGEFTSPRWPWSTWMVHIRWKMVMDKKETPTWRSTVSSPIWSSIQRYHNMLMKILKQRKFTGEKTVVQNDITSTRWQLPYHFVQRKFWQRSKQNPSHVRPGGTSEPTASLPRQTYSGWSKDESICQNDPLSGVLGGSQALCQPAPQRQHD